MGFLISFDDLVGGHKQCFQHFEALTAVKGRECFVFCVAPFAYLIPE